MNISCPVCGLSHDATPGVKFACGCGQRLATPPANRTILVGHDDVPILDRACDPPPAPPRYEEDDDGDRRPAREGRDRRTRYCPHCDRRVRPDVSKRMAQPWGLVFVIVGGVLVFFLIGIALLVIGLLLKQRVETCPDCGEELHVGDANFAS